MKQADLPLSPPKPCAIHVGMRVRLPRMPGVIYRHQEGEVAVVIKKLEDDEELCHFWRLQMEEIQWDTLDMLGIHLLEGEILPPKSA